MTQKPHANRPLPFMLQLRLSETHYRFLAMMAAQLDRPMAEVAREGIDRYIDGFATTKGPRTLRQALEDGDAGLDELNELLEAERVTSTPDA